MEHGVLLVNKPKGLTSHDVVNIARRALKTKKIGHIGTLDPHATGLLVLCVNQATKLVKYFSGQSKKYHAEIIIGVQTDTDDITGSVVGEEDASHLNEEKIYSSLMSFLGKNNQVPPNYSAIKVGGKKLYELARKDIEIDNIKPREVEIKSIEHFKIINISDKIKFSVDLHVSKGTYIRSIARDLGEKLNSFGTLNELHRTEIDDFKIEDAFTIDQIKNGDFKLVSPFGFLKMPKLKVDKQVQAHVEYGRFLDPELFEEKVETILYSQEGEVLAIYRYDKQKNIMRMSVKWN